MRDMILNLALPLLLFMLMVIVGTELMRDDLTRALRQPRAALVGVSTQLVFLPPLVLLVATIAGLGPFLTLSLLLLSLCPGGAISNTYSYLARCNVALAATITALGTLCSLISIPVWLAFASRWTAVGDTMVTAPAATILSQLLVLMVLPLGLGALIRHLWPGLIARAGRHLRFLSLTTVVIILVCATWAVRGDLYAIGGRIALAAFLFILSAMLLARIAAFGLTPRDAPVLVIECAVRNVAIAAIIGRILFSEADFNRFGGFLTGYFIVEILIMIAYAQHVRRRLQT